MLMRTEVQAIKKEPWRNLSLSFDTYFLYSLPLAWSDSAETYVTKSCHLHVFWKAFR